MTEPLFCERGKLSAALNERRKFMQTDINNYQASYLLSVSQTDLVEYLFSKWALEPLVILEDEIHQREPEDTKIHIQHRHHGPISVEGTLFTIVVPFDGNAMLFHHQPSHSTYNPPRGEVYPNKIVLTFEMHQTDEQELRKSITKELGSIRKYIEWVNLDVKQYNESLRKAITRAITRRRKKLLADRKLSQSLGIPVVRRENAPKTYVVPGIKSKPKIMRSPTITEEPLKPEPTLEYGEYMNILDIIRSMTRVMEQSPKAFVKMGEEDLRTHFLVQLNGQYEGQATGETFNFQGKTDILIKAEGKNIFIAECKFWKGPKKLIEAIDQLLNYLSWRDTKTAILLFNQNLSFSDVLGKIPETVEKHRCYKESESTQGETEFRYIFHQPGDPNREIILTILAFDIPRITGK